MGGGGGAGGLGGLDELLKGLGGAGGEGGGLGGIEELLKKLGGGEGGMEGLSEMMKGLGSMGDMPGMPGGRAGAKKGSREKFCKEKKMWPVPKMNMFAEGNLVANGCGPDGLKTEEPYGLYKCCNRHDLCYSVCDSGFDWCERDFKKCMRAICKKQGSKEEQKECQDTANGFTSVTGMGGEVFYMDGQKKACEETCLPKEEALEKFKDFLTEFYKDHNPNQVGEVDETLKKYKNKEGQLWLGLLRKYGVEKKLVEFQEIHEEL
jgi:hypothetical protein